MLRRPLRAVALPLVLSLGLLVAATGCGKQVAGDATPARPTGLPSGIRMEQAAPVAPATPTAHALSVEVPGGRKLTVKAKPTRVVCLTGACDDMLFSLGLQPVGTSTPALLALPRYLGSRSAEVTTIPGSFGKENVEAIAALKPDLVIGPAGVHEQQRAAIEQFAPLWTLSVKNPEQSVTNLRALATLVDRGTEQARVETTFRQKVADAKATAAKHQLKGVPVLSMYSSGAGRGVNTDSDLLGLLLAEIFTYPWPAKPGGFDTAQAYSTEEILQKNRKVIFLQSFTAPGQKRASEELAADPAWARIDAVKGKKVIEVAPALWASGRGPHALGLVLDEAIGALN